VKFSCEKEPVSDMLNEPCRSRGIVSGPSPGFFSGMATAGPQAVAAANRYSKFACYMWKATDGLGELSSTGN